MEAPVKLQRKKGKLARKLVIFGDQNTECHRPHAIFVCPKNVDQKGPSEELVLEVLVVLLDKQRVILAVVQAGS